ncbi:unnamed protein product [Ectocarpus sp. 12 AP-2014]
MSSQSTQFEKARIPPGCHINLHKEEPFIVSANIVQQAAQTHRIQQHPTYTGAARITTIPTGGRARKIPYHIYYIHHITPCSARTALDDKSVFVHDHSCAYGGGGNSNAVFHGARLHEPKTTGG